jgi:hypothetical protein
MFLGFMSLTHALIAAAGVCLILSTADPHPAFSLIEKAISFQSSV